MKNFKDVRMSLGIIIPVYKNANSLPELFQELRNLESQTKTWKVKQEIVFVIDGSPDNSLEIIQNEKKVEDRKNWTILSLTKNFGQISAILAGLQYSQNTANVCISADLQDPPELILEFLRNFMNGFEVVIGYRSQREDGWLARVTSRVAYKILSSEYENLPKGGFDFFLVSKRATELLVKQESKRRFLQGDVLNLGLKTLFIPYVRRKRKIGKSAYNLISRGILFLEFLFDSTYKPLRWITLIGFTFLLGSTFVVCSALISYLVSDETIKGFTPIFMGVFFFGGFQLFAIGILGEYILRTHEIVRKKPYWVISNQL